MGVRVELVEIYVSTFYTDMLITCLFSNKGTHLATVKIKWNNVSQTFLMVIIIWNVLLHKRRGKKSLRQTHKFLGPIADPLNENVHDRGQGSYLFNKSLR